MSLYPCRRFLIASLSVVALLGLVWPPRMSAQSGSQGNVVVTVTDPSGGVVPAADLSLVAQRTNDTRKAATTGSGSYTFVNLPIGTYTLTISKNGYDKAVYDSVLVQASQSTAVAAALKVGETDQTVNVSAETTPVLDTSSNAIGLVVDVKQIEDLPLQGRDLAQFSSLVAGFNGTFNGLPSTDQGSNIDGVIGNSSRDKFTGNIQPAVSPRLESIEQMTIQTDQLDLNSGFGQASTQANFVSRRGGNQFHGRVYEDFRNSGLNANSWGNDAAGLRKNKLILNDFGASVGGPVLHDKLFFFGTFAMSKQPGSISAGNDVFTAGAQAGNFTYSGGTVNLLTIAQQSGLAIPSAVNAQISSQFQAINTAVKSGALTPTSNSNFNQLNWITPSPITSYFPAARGDWSLSEKARMYLSFLMTKVTQPSIAAATFPGSDFANQVAGQGSKSYTSSYGFDYIFTPEIINQLKVGFLYTATQYAVGAAPLYATQPTVAWAYPGANGSMSGQIYQTPTNTYYPIFNVSDSLTWERGAHSFTFGGSWYREQDHYWNPPAGYPTFTLGLASGDPAINAFTNSGAGATLPGASSAEQAEAQQLYAVLTGRIASVSGESPYNIRTKSYSKPGEIGEYPLDERSDAVGLFAEDSFKAAPSLTFNYGLRWDFIGSQHDLTGFYHSASPSAIYGPSGINNLFNPGSLQGDLNPAITTNSRPYKPWKVTPQPSVGFAWNPKNLDGPLGRFLGDGDTVIRGGFALRRFTESYQYFWNAATDYGSFYYQYFNLLPNNTGATGTFSPGALALGDSLPPYGLSPAAYQETAPESQFTFQGSTPVFGMDPNIKQPYSESWNLGIQRSLGKSRALEIRYNGNRSIHQWVTINPNEINIFENGFLAEFKRAQANLAAGNGTNFSSGNGQPTPILDAAFGGPGASDYSNAQFINYLNTGQAGALANKLAGIAGTVPYLCNLVGASFSPCPNNAGYTGGGAGYPINFFQANPYAAGTNGANGANGTGLQTAAGYSNYHAVQIDLRQGAWHGLQYDANYTYSHSLGVNSPNTWTGSFNAFTLRDLRKSYGPTLFDLQNVFHASGTYDLPFGRGKQFLSNGRLLDKAVGGWTLGTIITAQSGGPSQITGQFNTFNDYGDSGVTLNGVTASQLQKSVGVHRVPGQTFADVIDPKYLVSTTGGGANPAYISPNTTPGTIGQIIYLHGPHAFYQDLSISKAVPFSERFHFRLQGEFLNVWNHPVFGNPPAFGGTPGFFDLNSFPYSSPTAGVQDYGFGLTGVTNTARIIELRANFEF